MFVIYYKASQAGSYGEAVQKSDFAIAEREDYFAVVDYVTRTVYESPEASHQFLLVERIEDLAGHSFREYCNETAGTWKVSGPEAEDEDDRMAGLYAVTAETAERVTMRVAARLASPDYAVKPVERVVATTRFSAEDLKAAAAGLAEYHARQPSSKTQPPAG